ncbi:hypothetical protein JCM3765_007384, partial [Sporobolomyces pararoseus]
NTTQAISSSFTNLMLLPSKISTGISSSVGGGIKLIKVSSSNGTNKRGEEEEETSYREQEEEEEEEESSSGGENSESSEEELESESESGEGEENEELYESTKTDDDRIGGTIGRESMDLRLEEATTGPTSVLDTPLQTSSSSFEHSSTSPAPPPRLHRNPSIAFKQASTESPLNPLTLQAIKRQTDSEVEALRVVEEMGAVFKRRDTREGGEGEGQVSSSSMMMLGRVRSESPTEMDTSQPGQLQQEPREKGGIEREREDSQATIVKSTPRSVSMIGVGTGQPPPSSSSSSNRFNNQVGGGGGGNRSVSGISTMTTESTKQKKKSFFSRFKKDKSSSSSKSTTIAPMIESTSVSSSGGGGIKRSGSLMSNRTNRTEPPLPTSTTASDFTGEAAIKTGASLHKIRYPKVRTKGKSRKDFNKLFLAQELYLTTPTSTTSTTNEVETSSIHSVRQGQGLGGEEEQSTTTPETTTEVPSPVASSSPSKEKTSSTAAGGGGGGGGSTGKQSKAVWALKFSNNGKWLAVGGRDGIVRIWEVLLTKQERENQSRAGTGGGILPIFKTKPIREYKGHTSDVLDLNWSKNDFLLSSSMDKTVRLWHIDRDECLCSFEHLDFVTSIAFHPKDDRFFLSGSLDCKLRLWNIVEKKVQVWTELPELITAVSFTRDGEFCCAGSFIGTVMFFEVETFRFHNIFTAKSSKRKAEQKGKKITSLVTFPLGSFNPSSSIDANTTTTDDDEDNEGSLKRVRTRQLREECDRLLCTSNDSHIRLYNTKGRYIEAKYSGHENTSSQIRASFSDDGKFIISGSEDRHVYIWDSGIARNSFGDFEVVKKRTEGAGYESFSMSAHIVTAAIFSPSTTRSHLAKSGDPIFGNHDNYPQLDPLPYSNTRSSLGAQSEKSDYNTNRKGSSSSKNAEDMIIVVADAETGVISVFRNSKIPSSVLVTSSSFATTPSAPTSAAGSIFRHNNIHGASSISMAASTTTGKEKRWSRASATSH